MKTKFIFLILLTALTSTLVMAQLEGIDKVKILQMAQSGTLSNLSPDSIRALIGRAGMTETEMLQYAREQNIEFAKYLQKVEEATKPLPISQPAARKAITSVPGFANRAGAEQLKPFGYDIFQYSPTTFEPVMNAPTPTSYRVGSGDELIITVWGQTQLNYELIISRDGYIVIPDVGKVQVEGQTIDQVKQRLLNRMTQVYEGLKNGAPGATTFLEVSLGKIRTIQVFVLGNATVPGGYNLSGLSTAFTALYYAGGPGVEGSLRKIRVIHGTTRTDTVDFYDFILFGNKVKDVRLQDGDAVFIPPASKRIAIIGAINQSAIYELLPGESLKDLLTMAGGLRYSAYDRRIHIERVIPFKDRTKYNKNILDLDVQFSGTGELLSSTYSLEDGDIISIYSVNEERENLITIVGNIRKPGKYQLLPGMRVQDLIVKADGLFEDTFLDFASLVRVRPDLKREVLSFNIRKAMAGDTAQNIQLNRLDEVTIYKEEFFRPTFTITIDGAVRVPGTYNRTEHMTVRDAIVRAGGLLESADLEQIEVSRIDSTTPRQISQVFRTSLPADYWNSSSGNEFGLKDFDRISIRIKPEFNRLKTVLVTGEAIFPGSYAIKYEGEKLSSLIQRFGGFKPTAYLPGIRFIRESGKFNIYHPDQDVVANAQFDTLMLKYNVLRKPRLASNAVPIDIRRAIEDTSSIDNIVLQDGDEVVIPRDPGVVYVQGQVYVPSSVSYKKGETLKYYLKQAGGLTRDADDDNIVVVLPNGKKWESGGLFGTSQEITAGSTIIAPLKIEEPSKTLELLREWSTIAATTVTLGFIVWQVSK